MSALVRNDCPPIEIVGAGIIVFVCSIEYCLEVELNRSVGSPRDGGMERRMK